LKVVVYCLKIVRTYRELKKLNSPKINEPIKKWASEQNFLKRRNSNGQKTQEKLVTICSHKGNENQNYTKIPPHPFRIAIIRNTTNNRSWRGCGEKGTLIHCWWECKLVQPLWKKNLETS
jgi:hypothetical protein